MKHSIQQLIYIIMLMNFTAVFSQTQNFEKETEALNCFYTAFRDNGVSFKKLIQNAENKLIKQKVLKDATGESYLDLYKNLETLVQEDIKGLGIQDYITNVMIGTNEFTFDTFRKCTEIMRNKENFEESRMNKNTDFIKAIRKNNTSMNISEIGDEILKRFTAKDFEHDYYKLMTFTFLEAYYVEAEIIEVDPSEELSAEELESAFNIEMQPKGKLFVSGEKITLKELRKKVIAYLQKHKSENVVVLKYDLDVQYKFYISVQNEVTQAYKAIRDKASREKYNLLFEELTTAQQKEIKEIYPMKIIESE